MNPWQLAWIIPLTLLGGALLGSIITFWYFASQIKKTMGIKSWKEFQKKMKEAQKLQEQIQKGHLKMDEDLRKKMEEMARQFSQSH